MERNFFKKYFPIMSTTFLVVLIFLFVLRVFYARPALVASIIEDDIRQITLMLEKIDARCNILSIDDDRNEVDFLNVKSFTGSKVGPFNLAYPRRWEGPYLHVNPSISGKHYEIIKAADGVFVVPGQGVNLPNGFEIGKDFVLDRKTAVNSLLREGGHLRYGKKKFATKLTFKIGDWDSWHLKEKTVKDLDRMIREFNETMPFTKNESVVAYESEVLNM
jgi:hypothetical protein